MSIEGHTVTKLAQRVIRYPQPCPNITVDKSNPFQSVFQKEIPFIFGENK